MKKGKRWVSGGKKQVHEWVRSVEEGGMGGWAVRGGLFLSTIMTQTVMLCFQ